MQPTGWARNSLKTRLRAELVYTYIESGGGVSINRTIIPSFRKKLYYCHYSGHRGPQILSSRAACWSALC